MRATRAYLAGFGTSGSLLAGAALMFVLVSAFVAFKGWPQVAGGSSPALVSVPAANTTAATRASRALSHTTAAPTHRTLAAVGHRHATTAGGLAHGSNNAQVTPLRSRTGSHQTTGSPSSSTPGTTTHHSFGPTPTPRTCVLPCSPSGGNGTVPTVRKTIHKTTTGANSTVGNVVTTVKKVVGGGGSSGSGHGGGVGGVVTTATHVVKKVIGGVGGGLP